MQQLQWKGATSMKFSGGRVHLKPKDQLDSVGNNINYQTFKEGIKTYTHQTSKEIIFKPTIKMLPEVHQFRSKDINLKGKKPLKPFEQSERIRLERSHLQGGKQSYQEQSWRGIKTCLKSNSSKKQQWELQHKMQKKMKIMGLDMQRNYVGVNALGDKSYKYPEYSSEFFHQGGLIVGSTQKNRRSSANALKGVITKPNWDVVVKMQQEAEEKKVLDSIDQWEQTVLKQANPKWRDPDTFFDQEEQKQPSKDIKKAGKK